MSPPGAAKEVLRRKARRGGLLWRKPAAALKKKPSGKEPAPREERARELQVSVLRVSGGRGVRTCAELSPCDELTLPRWKILVILRNVAVCSES